MKDVSVAYFNLKGMFGTLNVDYNTGMIIFITGNKICCNGITKPIHYFGCEL